MRKNAGYFPALLICVSLLAVVGSPVFGDEVSQASELWTQMRRENVNSREFAEARVSLIDLIDKLPASKKADVATALMARGADDAINAAALELFGRDPLPAKAIQIILNNPKRTWPQRVLVRTCYKCIRPEYDSMYTEPVRRQLVAVLAHRLEGLAKYDKVSYGEQRLISHALQAVLARYAGKESSVPDMARLKAAMRDYIVTRRQDDPLGASIAAWDGMVPDPRIDSVKNAQLALGHWDPLVRMKAATYLGDKIRTMPAVGSMVLQQLDDPRDEVRAAAASVFSFALSYDPGKVIPAMVKLISKDRSVPAQAAASETLIAHSEEAQRSVDLLLDALQNRKPKAGPKRTTSILQTLSYLVHPKTPPSQKKRLLDVAVANLSFAPEGALRAFEALGPFAKPALNQIKEYRDTKADRFTRQYINRHVLQTIAPGSENN